MADEPKAVVMFVAERFWTAASNSAAVVTVASVPRTFNVDQPSASVGAAGKAFGVVPVGGNEMAWLLRIRPAKAVKVKNAVFSFIRFSRFVVSLV